MPVPIKIISLNRNELIIEPVQHRDLSLEFKELQRELMAPNCDLIEELDYVRVPSHQIKFETPSAVLRALNVIPTESFQQQEAKLAIDIQQKSIQYATEISSDECAERDQPFVDKAYQILVARFIQNITDIHNRFNLTLSVTAQLHRDTQFAINSSEEKADKDVLNRLMASLEHAIATEKSEPEFPQYSLPLIENSSALAPRYSEVLNSFKIYCQKTTEELSKIYDQQVKPFTQDLRAHNRL
ncbi:MAG: hypothetical protein P4M14_07335 [Gammaproteobacteria bacterium]|nr:hypothetical protein [Gammaproteobacteria bacterium]